MNAGFDSPSEGNIPQGTECDVAVVGGGPAGLAVATELKALGVARVIVLERFEEAGGIPRHCGHPPFGWREFRRILSGPAYAARLVVRARQAGVEIRTRVTVTAIRAGGVLELATTDGPARLRARRIVMATGNRETTRAQALVPGLRPVGVMNTAALQGFAYLEKRTPFRRPVILGSEMVSLSALLTCLRHGIRPVAMIEPEAAPRTWGPFLWLARFLRVPVLLGTEISAIEGRRRVTGVEVTGPKGRRRLECDGVILSGRFTPEATLARASGLTLNPGSLGPATDAQARCSDPHVFAIGNLVHPVETAGHCWAEGRALARRVLDDLAEAEIGAKVGAEMSAEIEIGAGLRYVTPNRLDGRRPVTLNIRAEGPVDGRLVLRDAAGEILASGAARGYSQRPLRLDVPRLPRQALSGGLSLTLERS